MNDDETAGDGGELMGIGAFARLVGLAPSALRFYDDCGVLRPAYVDEVTGYRSYAPRQEARAVLVRRLREAGLPLTEATVVLDGDRRRAQEVLAEHARTVRRTAAAAHATIADVLRQLDEAAGETARAAVGGAEWASALRQVAPAVAPAAARRAFPVLGRVLVEIDGHEVRVVATDRYRLAVRELRPTSVEAAAGGPVRLTLEAGAVAEVVAWALRQSEVVITASAEAAEGGRLSGDDRTTWPLLSAAAEEGAYPEYGAVLAGLPPVRQRIVVDRGALCAAVADGARATGALRLTATAHRLTIASGPGPGAELPAIGTGVPVPFAMDPDVLLPALEASVGPDVLLEVADATQPVVIRSADQGGFTTLAMPVRLTADATPDTDTDTAC
ncbi:MerR family transcriptional regulator [Streptomyces sp. NPDC047315]|uniref:MerR family transcriptional regulator n=1 Tax=Streptomyces sp. NPDC047315 TaxID=3155142 RepID=UPI0033C168DC